VLTIPVQNRSSFTELVQICSEYLADIAQKILKHRPIYLLGESFGGLLALAVASHCRDIVDRIVLVNPATSYKESMWPQVHSQTISYTCLLGCIGLCSRAAHLDAPACCVFALFPSEQPSPVSVG
jgi:pimeloyl-ACP methyl ester carboxylesterase